MHGFFDNKPGMRSCRDGPLEAIESFVIKKNLQSHRALVCQHEQSRRWPLESEIQSKKLIEAVRFPYPSLDCVLSIGHAAMNLATFGEINVRYGSGSAVLSTANLPRKFLRTSSEDKIAA